MGRLTKFYLGILLISIIFAAWGFGRWLQAQAFTLETPAPIAPPRYAYQQPQRLLPLARYAKLQKGELFFGPELKTATPPPEGPLKVEVKREEFSSKLLLYGVTKGLSAVTDRAVVGLTADPNQQTWLVQPGSVVNGERVVKIEAQGIWVKNETGKGRVGLKRE
jgi:hypothetical protein